MNIPPPPPRWIALALLLLVPALLALAACGGGDDGGGPFEPGNLTNPERVPTATPWANPPEIVILDADNINPLPPDNPNQTAPTEAPQPNGGEPGVCGDTYTVEAGDFLTTIGEKCGVDWELIAELNPDADPASLSIGQVLNMPSADAANTE